MANEPFVGGAGAEVLFGVHGDQIIRIIVIVSVLGTINGIVLATACGLLAMGRDGLFAHHVTLLPQRFFCPGRSARCMACLPYCWG
jgi:amino acid transporter